jgi:hypothetical protein
VLKSVEANGTVAVVATFCTTMIVSIFVATWVPVLNFVNIWYEPTGAELLL